MKHMRTTATLAIFSVLAFIGFVALLTPLKAFAEDDGAGRTGSVYVITVNDSGGNFASRGVIALHADRTMSVTDSGQGGPVFFFTSQLGSWKPAGTGTILAKTIDFDYPPNAAVARVDYTISIAPGGAHIAGTITLTTFPLQGDPLGGGGTVVGTFTFTGNRVQ